MYVYTFLTNPPPVTAFYSGSHRPTPPRREPTTNKHSSKQENSLIINKTEKNEANNKFNGAAIRINEFRMYE